MGSVGAEIGVWEGGFARRILATLAPTMLYLVDPWRFVPAYPNALYGGRSACSQEDMDRIFDRVCSELGADPRIRLVRRPSTEAAAEIESLDWAYIDGDHTYAAVCADLDAYVAKLRPGGLLCGDDYGLAGWWDDGVSRAVDRFEAEHPEFVLEIIGSQWIFRPRAVPACGGS